jgi:hypothetical protein
MIYVLIIFLMLCVSGALLLRVLYIIEIRKYEKTKLYIASELLRMYTEEIERNKNGNILQSDDDLLNTQK